MRSLPQTCAVFGRVILLWLVMAVTVPTYASETITSTYDAPGRLVARTGTVNSGASESYSYDLGDNRTNVTVTAGTASPGGTLTNSQAIGTLREVDKNPCPLC